MASTKRSASRQFHGIYNNTVIGRGPWWTRNRSSFWSKVQNNNKRTCLPLQCAFHFLVKWNNELQHSGKSSILLKLLCGVLPRYHKWQSKLTVGVLSGQGLESQRSQGQGAIEGHTVVMQYQDLFIVSLTIDARDSLMRTHKKGLCQSQLILSIVDNKQSVPIVNCHSPFVM